MKKKEKKHLVHVGVFLAIAGVGVSAITWKLKSASESLGSEENRSLYAVGQMLARKSDYLHLSEKEVELVLRGFRDWTVMKKSIIDYESQLQGVEKLVSQRVNFVSDHEKEKGKHYLDKFVKSGGKLTESGLAYKIVKKGSDKKPKSTDSVEVHYHGTLIDGQVFDSSVDRKEKAEFPLNHVIPGWTEGLQLIGEGGEIELVIPSSLAYGDQGTLPAIPGGATLVFKIQLFKVNHE